jgi:hypothetical protein
MPSPQRTAFLTDHHTRKLATFVSADRSAQSSVPQNAGESKTNRVAVPVPILARRNKLCLFCLEPSPTDRMTTQEGFLPVRSARSNPSAELD